MHLKSPLGLRCAWSLVLLSAPALQAQDPPPQAGIGIALGIEEGKVFVTAVLPDTPAARSNSIKSNDEIIAVAEGDETPIDVTGTTDIAKIVGMIRGAKGTVVRLTVLPEGKAETDRLVVSLTRGQIKEIDSFIDGRLLAVGEKAPDFKFARLGEPGEGDLRQLAGEIVVVEFWASWCGPCIKALDELESHGEQNAEWMNEVEVLAVSVDESKEDAASLFEAKQWSNVSTVWAGPEVLKLYRIGGLPKVFVIDRDGKVVAADNHVDIVAVVKRLL